MDRRSGLEVRIQTCLTPGSAIRQRWLAHSLRHNSPYTFSYNYEQVRGQEADGPFGGVVPRETRTPEGTRQGFGRLRSMGEQLGYRPAHTQPRTRVADPVFFATPWPRPSRTSLFKKKSTPRFSPGKEVCEKASGTYRCRIVAELSLKG